MGNRIAALILLLLGVFLWRVFEGDFSPVSDNLGWWFGQEKVGPWLSRLRNGGGL